MPDLCAAIHEISVAFGCSTNLRTLTLRLADAMGRHLPIAEIETVRLIAHRAEVGICAYAPGTCRRWEGRRSSRFLEHQGVVVSIFVRDELARVAIAPVAVKLKIPVGRVGILAIAFETDISVVLDSREATEMLVDVLTLHCLRLGQLLTVAARCRAVLHREIGTASSVEKAAHVGSTDISLSCASSASRSADGRELTEISVSPQVTDISVETIDAALIRCISAALDHSRGKIYGPGGAAELLGLKPSTLQSKMRKLGIERENFAH